jgi:tetratricopeptide (TPR) repeat protein
VLAAHDAPWAQALLAYHARLCGDEELALDALARAAQQAVKRGLFENTLEIGAHAAPLLHRSESPRALANQAALALAVSRACVKLGNAQGACAALEDLPPLESLERSQRIAALCEMADVHYVTGQFEDVVDRLLEELKEAPEGTVDSAELYFNLGVALRRTPEWERARECFARSRDIFLEQGLENRAVDCLHQAANSYRQENRPQEAEFLLSEAVELTRAGRNRADLAGTLLSLGATAAVSGNLELAEASLVEARDLLQDLGDAGRLDMCRVQLGSVFAWQDRLEDAMTVLLSTLKASRRRNDSNRAIYALLRLGVVSLEQGEPERALGRLTEARAESENVALKLALAPCMAAQARALLDLGRLEDARAVADHAAALAIEHRQLEFLALSRALSGEAAAREGNQALAGARFTEAQEAFTEFKALGRTSPDVCQGEVYLRCARGAQPQAPATKVWLELAVLDLRRQLENGFRSRARMLAEAEQRLAAATSSA